MKLTNAALFFDRDTVYCAYTGQKLWKGQFSSYDGSKPDGTFERRRVISVAPGLPHPPRSVVKVNNSPWVIGNFIEDTFFDGPIRQTANAKLATDIYNILSPGQVTDPYLSVQGIYAQTRHIKNTVNSLQTSQLNPMYEVSFGISEVIPSGYYLRTPKRLLRIREVAEELEGFIVAKADEINLTGVTQPDEAGLVEALVQGAFDPLTESYPRVGSTVGVLLPMYMAYKYVTEADESQKKGDKVFVVSEAAVVEVGDRLTIAGITWQVVTKGKQADGFNLHIRRA